MTAPLAFNHRQRLNRPVGAQFVKRHSGGSVAQSDRLLVGNNQCPAGIPPDHSPHCTGKRRHFDDPAAVSRRSKPASDRHGGERPAFRSHSTYRTSNGTSAGGVL